LIHQVYGLSNLGDEFQILHASPDGHSQLVRVHDTVKRNAFSLSSCRLSEQVVVSRKQHSPDLTRPVQYTSVIKLISPVFLSGDHVHFAETKPKRYRPRNVVIHVEDNGH